jgi:glutathione S-transferase
MTALALSETVKRQHVALAQRLAAMPTQALVATRTVLREANQRTLDAQLRAQAFLAGEHFGLTDAAIAPFVRQYAHTDPGWFAAQAWPALIAWLAAFEASERFAAIMHKHAPWPEPATVV